MAACCQNLMLGALSSRSALSVLVGLKKFSLFLNTPRIRTHMSSEVLGDSGGRAYLPQTVEWP